MCGLYSVFTLYLQIYYLSHLVICHAFLAEKNLFGLVLVYTSCENLQKFWFPHFFFHIPNFNLRCALPITL